MKLRRPFKILAILLATLLLLVALLLFALHQPATQRWLTPKLETWLQQKLQTEIEVGSIGVKFPKALEIKDLKIKMPGGDSLLHVGSLVVDMELWALFDRTISIQKIGLENASVHLRRENGRFNFDFITEAFASPQGKNPPTPTDTSGGFRVLLQATDIDLSNIAFDWQDLDNQQFIVAKLGNAEIEVKNADLPTNRFFLKNLVLANADISFRQLASAKADTSASASFFEMTLENGKLSRTHIFYETDSLLLDANFGEAEFKNFSLNTAENGLNLSGSRIELASSVAAIRQKNATSTPTRFNPADLNLQSLNALLQDFSYKNEALQVEVNSLSGSEKSGLALRRLQGKIAYSPMGISVQDLDLQANKTNLTGTIVVQFGEAGQAPLSHFSAALAQSGGTVGDLLRFLPPNEQFAFLEEMADQTWSAEGKAEGTMSRIFTDHFSFLFGKNTRLRSSGNIANFSKPDQLSANLQLADFQFDKNDFTPFLEGKNWLLPAFAQAAGTVRGTAGKLSLDLAGSFGNLDSLAASPARPDTARFDLSGNFQGLGNPKTMQIDLAIRRFEAPGRLFAAFVPPEITLPDHLALSGTAKGGLSDLLADLQFDARRAEALSNLDVKGSLQNLDSLEILRFDLAFSGKVAKQEIFGYLPDSLISPYLDLPPVISVAGKAKGKPDDLAVTTDIGLGEQGSLALDGVLKDEKYSAKIEGKRLKINELAADSLLPQLRLLDLSVQLDGQGFDFEKNATASLDGQIRLLSWDTLNFENLALSGNLSGKKFSAKLTSPDPRLHLDLLANGDFGGAKPSLDWDARFDCLDLEAFGLSEKNAFACFRLRGNSTGLSADTLDALVFLENIDIQFDTLHIRPGDLQFSAAMHDGKNDLALASNWLNGWLQGNFDPATLPQTIEDLSQHYFKTKQSAVGTRQSAVGSGQSAADTLSFGVKMAHPDLFTSGIVPGLFQLDTFTMSGNLDAASRRFAFSTNLPLAGYESWTLKNLAFDAAGNGKTANFQLDIPELRQYEEAFVKNLSFAGSFDGSKADARLSAVDSTGKERFRLGLFAETGDFTNSYTLHLSPTQLIDYQDWALPASNSVTYAGQEILVKNLHLENGEQALRFDGSTKLLPDGKRSLGFTVGMEHLALVNFETLLAGSLKNLAGQLDGKLEIGGTTAAPKPSGSLALNDAKATVALTNVRYSLNDKALVFTPEGLDMSGLTLTDPQGNQLIINGLLKTSDWRGLHYDLEISTKKWLVLNTQKSQNPEYYGKVTVSVNGTVRGDLAEPEITVAVSPLKGSVLHYVNDLALARAEGNGVVVFVKPAGVRRQERKVLAKKYPFRLNLNLEINENLLLDVVADPVSGDNFEGTMEGRLSLEIFPDGKMNLAGRCEVKKGSYRYTYQQVVKRRFEVSPGSYLAWSGDPLNPDLQITARYVVRTSPYPLLAQGISGSDAANSPESRNFQTFFLNFKVTGDLRRPELDIDLEYPDDEALASGEALGNSGNEDIQSAVNTLNQDEAQLSQQVFGLLILSRFIGDTGGVSDASRNPIAAGLSDILTNQFNTLADQYLKFVDVRLDVKEDATFGEDDQYTGTTNYNLSLQKSFLNDRLVFKVSGGAAEDRGTDTQWRSSLENASVEYSLTPSGKLKIRAFSEDGLELLDSEGSRNSGAGIVFTKEFRRWFKRKGGEKR